MLNLNYNINKAIGGGGCIGVMKYSYSASFFLGGGGGGGAAGPQTAGGGGGGGGGGAQAFSASINIVPNVTYQVNIGAGGARGIASGDNAGGNGQTSSFIYWDDTDINGTVNINCAGGFGAIAGNGGNSANGFIGGIGLNGDRAGGGGAGTFQNGQDAAAPSGFTGGAGGAFGGGGGGGGRNFGGGAGSQYPSIVIPGSGGIEIDLAGVSGAVGGAGIPDVGNPGGDATFVGGGGGASDSNSTSFPGGNGGTGVLKIAYVGKPKAIVTNATTTTINNITTHTFASGSGTFTYVFPYPYEEPATPYQVEECPDKPTGAVFSVRNDPYSASIVVAIPGNLFFTGDYQNQFGMTTPFDDISAYVKGGGNPIGNNLTTATITTGSFIATATGSLIKWAEQHYDTSLYFSGSASLSVTNTWSANEGANLTFTKDFTIETWAAWPVTASISGSAPLWTPNRYLAYKYDPALTATSQYIFEPWGGDAGSGRIISGSSRFIYDTSAGEFYVTSSFNNSINVNEFNHYAVSYTVVDPNDPGVARKLRLYINGALEGLYTVPAGDMNQDTTELLQMFGAVDTSVPAEQDVTSGTAGYFTDFRMYNGSNKNYTASLIPLPESMVVWN
jgi:hypothetical protein